MGVTALQFDTASPHPGVVIDADGTAVRETNGGWVTLRSTQPLSATERQWGVKVLDHGESGDGSGMMLGLIPKPSPHAAPMLGGKYISELNGWCLSRAGECYGTWKCDKLAFGTGSVVEFDVDAVSKTVHITSGRQSCVGHIPTLSDADELYPAVSLYYHGQKVCFV